MEMNHEFNVNVPLDQAWKVMTDLELIAPCLPGAQLQEVEGEIYRGIVKVKVGPIQAQFKGQATLAERDDDNHKAVLKADGRDTAGKGNASAVITAQLSSVSDAITTCAIHTDLSITGKMAQFGRGALADVSDKLLAQFADNLNTLLTNQPAATPVEPVQAPVEPSQPTVVTTSTPEPTVRKIDAPQAVPINLLGTAGGTIAKRVIPLAIGVVAIVIILIVAL